jgi:hypothetical protein
MRPGILVGMLGLAFTALITGDAMTVTVPSERASASNAPHPVWKPVEWAFRIDEWGTGQAYRCAPSDCGIEISLYLRAKVGFCNCTTGVSDDDDLDRVGDVGLFGQNFVGLADGRPVSVGAMNGRSRRYRVKLPHAALREVAAIGFNDQCDVAVATVVADAAALPQAERLALDFLNTAPVLRWAANELGRNGI